MDGGVGGGNGGGGPGNNPGKGPGAGPPLRQAAPKAFFSAGATAAKPVTSNRSFFRFGGGPSASSSGGQPPANNSNQVVPTPHRRPQPATNATQPSSHDSNPTSSPIPLDEDVDDKPAGAPSFERRASANGPPGGAVHQPRPFNAGGRLQQHQLPPHQPQSPHHLDNAMSQDDHLRSPGGGSQGSQSSQGSRGKVCRGANDHVGGGGVGVGNGKEQGVDGVIASSHHGSGRGGAGQQVRQSRGGTVQQQTGPGMGAPQAPVFDHPHQSDPSGRSMVRSTAIKRRPTSSSANTYPGFRAPASSSQSSAVVPMGDVGMAMSEFGSSMMGGGGADDPTQMMMIFARMVSSTRDQQTRRIDTLEQELSSCRDYLATIETRASKLGATCEDYAAESVTLRHTIAQVEIEMANLRDGCAQYELQRKDFEKICRDFQAAKDTLVENCRVAKQTEEKNELLRDDLDRQIKYLNEKLAREAESVTAWKEKAELAEAETIRLQQRIASLDLVLAQKAAELDRLTEVSSAKAEEVQKSIANAHTAYESIKQENATLLATHRADVDRLEQRHRADLESQRAASESLLELALKSNADERALLSASHARETEHLASLHAERTAEQQARIAELDQRLQAAEERAAANSGELADVRETLAACRERLVGAEARAEKVVQEMQETVAVRDLECEALKEEVREVEEVRRFAEEAWGRERDDWEARKNALEETKSLLEDKIVALQVSLDETITSKDDLSAELEKVTGELKESLELCVSTEAKARELAAERNTVEEKLTGDITALSDEIVGLKARIVQLNADSSHQFSVMEELQRKLEVSSDRIDGMNAEIEAKDAASADIAKKLKESEQECERLRSDLSSKTTLMNDYLEEINSLKGHLADLQKSYATLESEKTAVEAEVLANEHELTNATNSIADVVRSSREAEVTLKNEINQLTGRVGELEATLKESNDERGKLKIELKCLSTKEQTVINQAKEQLHRQEAFLRNDLTMKAQETKNLEAQNASLRASLADQEKRTTELSAKVQAAKALEIQNANLRETIIEHELKSSDYLAQIEDAKAAETKLVTQNEKLLELVAALKADLKRAEERHPAHHGTWSVGRQPTSAGGGATRVDKKTPGERRATPLAPYQSAVRPAPTSAVRHKSFAEIDEIYPDEEDGEDISEIVKTISTHLESVPKVAHNVRSVTKAIVVDSQAEPLPAKTRGKRRPSKDKVEVVDEIEPAPKRTKRTKSMKTTAAAAPTTIRSAKPVPLALERTQPRAPASTGPVTVDPHSDDDYPPRTARQTYGVKRSLTMAPAAQHHQQQGQVGRPSRKAAAAGGRRRQLEIPTDDDGIAEDMLFAELMK
ncbi:hypothetical protein HK101_009750 [Irineochytrium annulatum]|nr:hypothetical protein HK101_009750 [Irineochytrium annulatum]